MAAEFAEHAAEEQQHADWLAERITQLDGEPDFNPEGLPSRSQSEYAEGTTPRVLTRPYEVLKPTTPQWVPGMRTEPPSSLPTEPKHNPAATAAADPAEDPPVILSKFHGL